MRGNLFECCCERVRGHLRGTDEMCVPSKHITQSSRTVQDGRAAQGRTVHPGSFRLRRLQDPQQRCNVGGKKIISRFCRQGNTCRGPSIVQSRLANRVHSFRGLFSSSFPLVASQQIKICWIQWQIKIMVPNGFIGSFIN